MALTREQILAKRKLAVITVDVPELGGEVLIRTWSALNRDEFENQCRWLRNMDDPNDCRGVIATAVALSVCDESGRLLLSLDDVDELQEQSAAAIGVIWDEIKRANCLGRQDVDRLKKSSATPPTNGSPTA